MTGKIVYRSECKIPSDNNKFGLALSQSMTTSSTASICSVENSALLSNAIHCALPTAFLIYPDVSTFAPIIKRQWMIRICLPLMLREALEVLVADLVAILCYFIEKYFPDGFSCQVVQLWIMYGEMNSA